jgi:hypothetical protein
VPTSDEGDDTAFAASIDDLASALEAYEALGFDEIIVGLRPQTQRLLDHLAEALPIRDW